MSCEGVYPNDALLQVDRPRPTTRGPNAMTMPPPGFAVAGTVLGAIGSIWAVVAGIGIVMGLLGLSRAAKTIADYANAHTQARQAYLQIDQQRRQAGATPLATADADAIAKRFND